MTMAAKPASTDQSSAWRVLLGIVFGGLLLVWPAIVNGGGFFFPDTSTYIRSADAAAGELTGMTSVWSEGRQSVIAGVQSAEFNAVGTSAAGSRAIRQISGGQGSAGEHRTGAKHPILLGRSIYYGLAVYPAMIVFGSVGVALLQALLTMVALWLAVIAMGARRDRAPTHIVITAVVVAAVSSLPFFVSLIMPDLFAGIAMLLSAAAVAGWNRLTRAERLILAALLMFCAMVHSSHVLLMMALTALSVVMSFGFRMVPRQLVALFACAAVAGLAGEQLFAASISYRLGVQPVRPPFLTARLIADGAGYEMLRARCPTVKLATCRYLDRMPADSDAFLWSTDAKEGVWSVEPIAVQIEIARQDRQFVFETLRFAPGRVAASTINAVARQMTLTSLNIFNRSAAPGESLSNNLPEPLSTEVKASRYANGTMPVAATEWGNRIAALFASLLLLLVATGRVLRKESRDLRAMAGFVLIGVLMNAAITGALSKPHDRYNVRMLWAVEVVAVVMLLGRASRRQRDAA